MAFPWAAALSAGTSLVSGLFGRKEEKKRQALAIAEARRQEHRDDTKLQRLVKDAEKAGFNPLTALRGGAGGFQQVHNPILSLGAHGGSLSAMAEQIGGSIQSAFDYDPLREEQAQLQTQLMRAELDRITRDGNGVGFGQVPTAVGSRYSQNRIDQTFQTVYDNGRIVEDVPATRTNPWPVPWNMEPAPWRVDGGAAEESLGEPAGWLAAPYNITSDIVWNLDRVRRHVGLSRQGFRNDVRVAADVWRRLRGNNRSTGRNAARVEYTDPHFQQSWGW